jgi:hypothetical protein
LGTEKWIGVIIWEPAANPGVVPSTDIAVAPAVEMRNARRDIIGTLLWAVVLTGRLRMLGRIVVASILSREDIPSRKSSVATFILDLDITAFWIPQVIAMFRY